MQIIHISDVHFSETKQTKALQSLEHLLQNESPDLWVIAGDLFDKAIQNTDVSGFPKLINILTRFLDVAPIVAVSGTPTHDIEGCYKVLEAIRAKHQFIYLDALNPYHLFQNNFLVMGMGEPIDSKTVKKDFRHLIKMRNDLYASHQINGFIFIFHGLVKGAQLSPNNYFNFKHHITLRQLTSIEADYYALGDIHNGQQLLAYPPVWYSGSIAPWSWGERDKKMYNIVSYKDNRIDVQRKPFPHDPMMKYDLTSLKDFPWSDCKGVKVWLKLSLNQSDISKYNQEDVMSDLFAAGALPESRVDIIQIANNEKRMQDIDKAKTLQAKVGLFASMNNQHIERSIYDKVAEIENILGHSIVLENKIIRILSLRLRGSIGLKDQSNLEDITLDLSEYKPGLIALIGCNRSGKTTLIENMIIWPRMLTRRGKLADHFYLKDSFREIIFSINGVPYKALIEIDGVLKSCKGYMYTWENYEWVLVPGISGRISDYETVCHNLWGPLDLYLRTSFSPQSPPKSKVDGNYITDFDNATSGELKAFMINLLGLGVYTQCVDYAKSKREIIDDHIHDINTSLNEKMIIVEYLDCLSSLEEAKEDLKANSEALSCKRKEKDEINTELQNALSLRSKQNELEKNLLEYQKQLSILEAQFCINNADIDRLESQISKKPDLENKVSEYNELLRVYDYTLNQLGTDITGPSLYKEETQTQVKIDKSMAIIEQYQIQLLDENRCALCKQKLPKLNQNQIDDITNNLEIESDLLEKYEFELDDIRRRLKIESELNQINEELSKIPIDDIKQSLNDIETIIPKVNLAKSSNDKINVNDLKLKIQETYNKIDQRVNKDVEYFQKELDIVQKQIWTFQGHIDRLNGEIDTLEEQHNKCMQIKNEIDILKNDLIKYQKMSDEWKYLEKVFGTNGLQAIEIDNAGPQISYIANKLLSAFGGNEQIRFDTIEQSTTGSNKEVFRIKIITTKDGIIDEKNFDQLSGGQKGWIHMALMYAFSIARQTTFNGIHHEVHFIDEMDDGLDPISKQKYFNMLQIALSEAKIYQAIYITHSLEAQQSISQKIFLPDTFIK